MNNMRILGHVLLWIGFLSGAFVAVRQADPPKQADEETVESSPGENGADPVAPDTADVNAEQTDPVANPDIDEESVESKTKDAETNSETSDVPARKDDVEKVATSSINWSLYLISLIIACVGVVLLRLNPKKIDAGQTNATAGTLEDLKPILDRLQTIVDSWIEQFDDIFVYDFHGLIDEHASNDLSDFADLRELMIPAFGLDHYALIMTEFALAERTLNRVWCASADGYIDEVRESLQRASDHLKNAKLRWGDAVTDKDKEKTPSAGEE